MFQLRILVVSLWVAVSSVAAFSFEKPPADTNCRRSLFLGGAAALVAGVTAGSAPAYAALGSGTVVGREIG